MARACCKYVTVSLVPVAALFLAVVFALGTLTLPILYTELAQKYQYGVVIDAGSSHTTMYIYKVEVPVDGNVDEIHYIKDNQFLDSFANDPAGAAEVVTDLINKSLSKTLPDDLRVPHEMVNTTHIYLGATAGMRLLRLKNSSATLADNILHAVHAALKNSSYFVDERARIITGKEEAAGGWTTVNYILKSKKGEYGSLDMGGASTEIAFLASPSKTDSSPFYTNETLFNRSDYTIYARSYLCYGHNEALARFLGHLINQNGGNGSFSNPFSNPCLPVSSRLNHTFSDINTSCVVDPIAEEVFGSILNLPSRYAPGDNVTFIGTGDVNKCLGNISAAFNFSACTPHLNCDGNGVFVPPPAKGPFIGFSGFLYVAEKFHIDNTTFKRSGPLLLPKFKEKCTDILKNKGNTTEYCFYGIFMGFMMEEGFGMTEDAKNDWNVNFKSKVTKSQFGWTMGYLMNRTTPEHYTGDPYHDSRPYTAVDLVVGMVVLTLLCAIFVIFFFLTFYACKKALEAHNGYQSIS